MNTAKWIGEKILTSLLQELGRRSGEAIADLIKRRLQKPAVNQ